MKPFLLSYELPPGISYSDAGNLFLQRYVFPIGLNPLKISTNENH